MVIYDLVLSTRREKLTGIERFALNVFKASRQRSDDVWGIVSDASMFSEQERLIKVDRPLFGWLSIQKYIPQLQRKKPVVICPSFPASPSLLFRDVLIGRVIHDDFAWSRSHDLSFLGRAMFKYYETMMLRFNTEVFAPSDASRQTLTNVLCRKDIRVCGNAPGLDCSNGDRTPVRDVLGKKFVLLVGTIEPRKNYELLLRLANAASNTDLIFVVVGRPGWGEVNAAFEAVPSNVLWLKDTDDAKLRWLYEHCDVFLSLSHAEGFNMPLVEAGMFGCKIICSNLPIHRSVAIGSAVFIPEGSEDLDVLHLLTSKIDAPSEQEVATYRGRFSWDAVVERLEAPLRARQCS